MSAVETCGNLRDSFFTCALPNCRPWTAVSRLVGFLYSRIYALEVVQQQPECLCALEIVDETCVALIPLRLVWVGEVD